MNGTGLPPSERNGDLLGRRVGDRAGAALRAQWSMADYEFRQLMLPRGTSRNAAWRLLTEQAEHYGWELDRLRLYPDGSRRVRLRRRILRVARTL